MAAATTITFRLAGADAELSVSEVSEIIASAVGPDADGGQIIVVAKGGSMQAGMVFEFSTNGLQVSK